MTSTLPHAAAVATQGISGSWRQKDEGLPPTLAPQKVARPSNSADPKKIRRMCLPWRFAACGRAGRCAKYPLRTRRAGLTGRMAPFADSMSAMDARGLSRASTSQTGALDAIEGGFVGRVASRRDESSLKL